MDDIAQMLEAQNARRRRDGRREITEADVEAQLREDDRWRTEHLGRTRRGDES